MLIATTTGVQTEKPAMPSLDGVMLSPRRLSRKSKTAQSRLTPFELSQDRLVQCLELGQVALDCRKADAAEREESFRRMVKEKVESNEPRNLAGL